jgi:hypothetical protein
MRPGLHPLEHRNSIGAADHSFAIDDERPTRQLCRSGGYCGIAVAPLGDFSTARLSPFFRKIMTVREGVEASAKKKLMGMHQCLTQQ